MHAQLHRAGGLQCGAHVKAHALLWQVKVVLLQNARQHQLGLHLRHGSAHTKTRPAAKGQVRIGLRWRVQRSIKAVGIKVLRRWPVRRVALRGLKGAAGQSRVAQPITLTGPEVLGIDAETDLVFNAHEGATVIDDPVLHRQLRVSKGGSRTTVVWNPWIAKAARMSDFGDHEWPGMICVEAANAQADAYQLAPGASHALSTVIEVL